MIQVNMNIASKGTGVLNTFPISWTCHTHKEWISGFRKDPIGWLHWSHHFGYPKSELIFYITIIEDCPDEEDLCWTWEFKVSAKNIREFQPFIKKGREEFEEVLKQWKRDGKLNEILND